MAKEVFMDFVRSHRKEYTLIGNYAKRHGLVLSLGDCPNQIVVIGNIPAAFRNYMKRNQHDFVVVEG